MKWGALWHKASDPFITAVGGPSIFPLSYRDTSTHTHTHTLNDSSLLWSEWCVYANTCRTVIHTVNVSHDSSRWNTARYQWHLRSGFICMLSVYLQYQLASFTWHTVAATVLCCGTVFSSRLQNWDSHTIKTFSYLDELLKHDSESPSNNKAAFFFQYLFQFLFFAPLSELFPLHLHNPYRKKKNGFWREAKWTLALFFLFFAWKARNNCKCPCTLTRLKESNCFSPLTTGV